MNTSSRFAVLAPEVDLDAAYRTKQRAKQDKAKNEAKNQAKIQNKNGKPTTGPIKKKKIAENDLQALAFGFGKGKGPKKAAPPNPKGSKEKGAPKGKKGKAGAQVTTNGGGNTNNDEDWCKRDEEFIQDENEKSLREAILQSKLDFEAKKKEDAEEGRRKERERKEAALLKAGKGKKRKEKPITISLDHFNSLRPKELATLRSDPSSGGGASDPPVANGGDKFDEKFFKDVEETTRKTLDKEHRQQQYKANANKVNHEIQVSRLLSEVEKRDFEIQALRLEVDSLQTQMMGVKGRNKKLCEVISSSEMRSKGELVVELEKASSRRDEFSAEMASLLGQLEQERTKVSTLTTELKKMQGRKRTADSSAK